MKPKKEEQIRYELNMEGKPELIIGENRILPKLGEYGLSQEQTEIFRAETSPIHLFDKEKLEYALVDSTILCMYAGADRYVQQLIDGGHGAYRILGNLGPKDDVLYLGGVRNPKFARKLLTTGRKQLKHNICLERDSLARNYDADLELCAIDSEEIMQEYFHPETVEDSSPERVPAYDPRAEHRRTEKRLLDIYAALHAFELAEEENWDQGARLVRKGFEALKEYDEDFMVLGFDPTEYLMSELNRYLRGERSDYSTIHEIFPEDIYLQL